ncbi:hypothetical protein G6F43_009997 [Rhizopus delemar]|nr:hypothetical protein G6F43_009997 [Rhizopus delemar]
MNANLYTKNNKGSWWRPYAPKKEDFADPDEYYKNMLQDYFHTYYQQEGYEALVTALEQWLQCCQDDFKEFDCLVLEVDEGMEPTTHNSAIHFAKAIQERVKEQAQIMDWPTPTSFEEILQPTIAHINTLHNPLPYYPCSDQSIKEWNDLLLEDWQKGNMEAANITKEYILEAYSEYKKAQQDLKRAHKKKQKAIEELATQVNRWSHFVFQRPNATQASVNRYLNAKHHQLKDILIDGRIDPILKKVIKQEDSWAHLHVPRHGTFEDELLSTPGICNTMQQTLAAFDFSLSN